MIHYTCFDLFMFNGIKWNKWVLKEVFFSMELNARPKPFIRTLDSAKKIPRETRLTPEERWFCHLLCASGLTNKEVANSLQRCFRAVKIALKHSDFSDLLQEVVHCQNCQNKITENCYGRVKDTSTLQEKLIPTSTYRIFVVNPFSNITGPWFTSFIIKRFLMLLQTVKHSHTIYASSIAF